MKAKVASRLLLALSACLLLVGCRTAGTSPSRRPQAPPSEPRPTFYLDDFVRDHNRNARHIQTVKASPAITAQWPDPDGGKPGGGSASGRLAIEQPHDFKLVLSVAARMREMADIGSNQDEFWFWFESKDKSIYRCSYEDLPTSHLPATLQPDWIATALGLRPITPDEAATAKITEGTTPGTTLLRIAAAGDPGTGSIRELTVDDATNRPVELRVFDRDGKTLLGRATIRRYAEVPLKTTVDVDIDDARTAEPIAGRIPDDLTLEWVREGLRLDIKMGKLTVNQPFSESVRTALFVPPQYSGYAMVDLAEASRSHFGGSPTSDTTVRETIPPPESSNIRRRIGSSSNNPEASGVRLGAPVEIEGARLQSDDDAEPTGRSKAGARPASRSNAPAPRRVAPVANPSLILPVFEDEVVRTTPPRSPEPIIPQTANAADVGYDLGFDR